MKKTEIPLKLRDDADGSMYVSEKKIHPRDVDGRFQRLRGIAVWVLLGMFYVFPWLNWEGRQSVLFDLPAHPDLLEQRIGRLDRIGQQHRIQLHVPYLEGSAQERLVHWDQQALNAFLATCPTGNALQHQFGSRLLEQLPGGPAGAWQALLEEARAHRDRLEQDMQRGRDRLLDKGVGLRA